MLLRRVFIVPFGVVAALLLGSGSALAAGPPVVNETDHPVNHTQSFPSNDPCTGAPGTLTITFSGVQHVTAFADGTAHFTDTLRGTFQFASADGTSTGTFVFWDGGNGSSTRTATWSGAPRPRSRSTAAVRGRTGARSAFTTTATRSPTPRA